MTLVVPKYRALLDDTDSVKDPLAHGLINLVEPEVAVTWDLIPFRDAVTQLKFERGQRSVSAREVITENNFETGHTEIDLTSATRKRVTDGHILYHPATEQRVVLDEANTTSGVCTIQHVQQAPGGSRTQIDAGETLYILSQSEFYEEINAESRFEDTDKVTNYVQDTTELLKWSRADLREGRKWGVDKQTMLKERMRDIMKDLNSSILYNVPQEATSTKSAITAGIDYMIQNAGSTVDASSSGTASLADLRGVLKTLQQNGVGPSSGLFALMSINVYHEYVESNELQQQVIDLGLRIFPLNGKKPTRNSHWKEEAGSEPVSTKSYGIACDDKITVVDTDTREMAIWWYKNRPRTDFMVKTPRGGIHYIYRGEGSNRQYEDADLRGNGGYICGVGSEIRGKVYELVNGCSITLDVPEFQWEWVAQWEQTPKQNTYVSDEIRNIRAYISKIQAISGERGHATTFRVACKLSDAGLSEAEVLAEMIEWNQSNASPPWEIKDLVHKTRDACTRNL